MLTRRNVIRVGLLGTLAGVYLPQMQGLAQTPPAPASAPTGPFTLPPLGYAYDALEPFIDSETMKIHHDKHHAAYVNNLNKALAGQAEWSAKSLEELILALDRVPESIRMAVRNNSGGHYNHSLFWKTLAKNGGKGPGSDLKKALEKTFKSFDGFKEQLSTAATGVFGSGWAWLSLTPTKELVIEKTPNQDTVLASGNLPLFGIDVWEHAYYLKYQNRRPDYIKAFFEVVNWEVVDDRYAKGLVAPSVKPMSAAV